MKTLEFGMTFDESITAFCRSRKLGTAGANKQATPRTIENYEYDLRPFFDHLRLRGRVYYNQIEDEDVTSYIERITSKSISDASKKKVWRSLKAFFNWVDKDGSCQREKMKGFQKLLPKIGKNAPRMYIPSPDVMNDFLHSFNVADTIGLRDFTATCVILDCGARISEVCGLNIEDVLWEDSKLHFPTGKTGGRTVPVNAEITLPYLRKWCRERERFSQSDALFITRSGGRCDDNTFDHSFERLRNKTGIGKTPEGNISPHVVRHYFCTHYLVNGGTLAGLQTFTGHMSLATLQIYLHMAEQIAFIRTEHTKASPLKSLGERKAKRRMVRA